MSPRESRLPRGRFPVVCTRMATSQEMTTGLGALFPVPASLRLARTLRWQFAFLLVIGVVFWGAYLRHEGDALHFGYKTDFLGVYVGARMAATGAESQLYDLPAQAAVCAEAVAPLKRSIMPFVYPAYVVMILRPLGMLEFQSALKVWALINVAAVCWSAIRLAGLSRRF